MPFWSVISRLLSILAVVGLLAAPMVTPSRAGAMDDVAATDMGDIATMSDRMPCCPHQKPAMPDCSKTCPMAILCMAKCFPGAPAASIFMPARFAVAEIKVPGSSLWRDLLAEPPPPRPPRT